jgi:hypothetical protein
VYFRKKADGIGFDLFSDIDSRIRHLNRILVLAGILAAMQLIVGGNGLRIALLAVRPDAFPLITSILCLSVGVLVTCGFLRIFIKRQQLRKEKILHE